MTELTESKTKLDALGDLCYFHYRLFVHNKILSEEQCQVS